MKTKGAILLAICVLLIGFLGYVVVKGLPLGTNKDGQPIALYPAIKAIRYGLDLKGGVTITYEPANKVTPTASQLNTVKEIMRNRLSSKGYFDANVTTSQNKRVIIEIPDITDPQKAVQELGQTALLEMIDVGNKSVIEGQVLTPQDGTVVLSGADIVDATSVAQGSAWQVNFTITKDAQKRFADATKRLVDTYGPGNGKIAIALDKKVISAPTVDSVINSNTATISGPSFTKDSSNSLAALIKAGALPFNLKPVSTEYVGALLGENAINVSVLAGIVGMAIVIIFMISRYRILGVAASLALIAYTFTILFLFARNFGIKITLTLPGIAGIILSIGFAVDANVIIFERIKEELRNGKKLKAAIEAGFQRGWPAIRDANVTTVISSAVLAYIGTGPIKGFAWTLIIGVIVSMLSAILLTRFIITQLYNLGIVSKGLYGVREEKA